MSRWDSAWHSRLNQILIDLPFKPLEQQAAIRRALARDPVAFALIYLRPHLRGKETGDRITFSVMHYDWAQLAESWVSVVTKPMEDRRGVVAPRGSGKSTWWFLILLLWAAANGYIRFAVAFAHSTGQAEGHLQTLKRELDTNSLLRHDYPELCTPARKAHGGTVADRQSMLHTASGFTFAAKGIDSQSLGLKVGEHRPDVIVLDDIEPDESNYTPYLVEKRLSTVIDAILPLNVYARVVMIGTVTMPGSIMHQLVQHSYGVVHSDWAATEQITVHHHKPIITASDGNEYSIWEAKWPLKWLLSRRHTREYAKNYDNDPLVGGGMYWSQDDFLYDPDFEGTRWGLFVDPAVTTKGRSDETGLTVISYDPVKKICCVHYSAGVRLIGAPLRKRTLWLIERFPRIKMIRVEVNQGHELWLDVFHDMPVKVVTCTESVGKEVRFAWALEWYQRTKVVHSSRMANLETQMVGFPRLLHDDIADSAVQGVLFFLQAPTVATYIEPSEHSYL